jgi:peroxiredoxin
LSGAVAVGMPAPEFTLADFEGRPFSLSSRRGVHHVVLVFNRGFT